MELCCVHLYIRPRICSRFRELGAQHRQADFEGRRSCGPRFRHSSFVVSRPEFRTVSAGLASAGHVYQDADRNKFTAVLNAVSVQDGRNSYYKLQLIERDAKRRLSVTALVWFHSRRPFQLLRLPGLGSRRHFDRKPQGGEVQNRPGSSQAAFRRVALSYTSANFSSSCQLSFRLYFEKTGNEWSDRHNFVKRPGKFMPVQVDYGPVGAPTLCKLTPAYMRCRNSRWVEWPRGRKPSCTWRSRISSRTSLTLPRWTKRSENSRFVCQLVLDIMFIRNNYRHFKLKVMIFSYPYKYLLHVLHTTNF